MLPLSLIFFSVPSCAAASKVNVKLSGTASQVTSNETARFMRFSRRWMSIL